MIKILGYVFLVLTFLGAGYVLFHKGEVNAGYAVIPMIITLACFSVSRKKRGPE